MGRDLAAAEPIVRATFAEADAALGEPLSRLCFEGPEEQLTLTEHTQPAILTASVAIYRLLAERGWTPDFYAGHSLGEYSAHVCAGTMGFADAVRIVRARGRFMQEAVPVGTGAMAAILGLDESSGCRGLRGGRAGRGRVACEPECAGAGRDCRNAARRSSARAWRPGHAGPDG